MKVMKSGNRPTGIIRTLPYGPKSKDKDKRDAYKKMLRGLGRLNGRGEAIVLIGMAQKPVQEVLHCYLLIEGHIIGRANISCFYNSTGPVRCWDNTTREHKWWAVLTGPFTTPAEPIKRRGTQGFRYVYEELW